MAKKKIADTDGLSALVAVREPSHEQPDHARVAVAVRYLLQLLEQRYPGRSVEVRVPPFGAVQCIAGPRHTRGTPANVIEIEPGAWVSLAVGDLSWQQALSTQQVSVSGVRADLTDLLPLINVPR